MTLCYFLNRRVIYLTYDYSKLLYSRFTIISKDTQCFLEKNGLFIHIGIQLDVPADSYFISEFCELGISVHYKHGYMISTFHLSLAKVYIRGPSYICDRLKTVYGLMLQIAPVKSDPVFEVVFPKLDKFFK